MYGRGGQDEGADAVVLCPCFSEVHKDILLWGKRCHMPSCPLQAPHVDCLLHSAVVLHRFAKCPGVYVVNKASPSCRQSRGVADLNKVGIVEEEEDR